MKTIKETLLKDMVLRVVKQRGAYVGVVISGDKIKARIEGDDPDDVWRRLHNEAAATSPKFHGFGDAKKRFLRIFARGFSSPAYFRQERGYKWEAKQYLERAVPLEAAADGSGHGEAVLAAFRKTNLLSPFESARMQALLRSPQADRFVRGAARFAMGDVARGLREMKAAAEPHGVAKWTAVTYLPFLWRTQEHMFLKPNITCEFAERVGHRFRHDYRPDLDPEVYRSLLDLTAATAAVVSDLEPADNIDIQGFIWVVGFYDVESEEGLDRDEVAD
jgi:hypothetical protein